MERSPFSAVSGPSCWGNTSIETRRPASISTDLILLLRSSPSVGSSDVFSLGSESLYKAFTVPKAPTFIHGCKLKLSCLERESARSMSCLSRTPATFFKLVSQANPQFHHWFLLQNLCQETPRKSLVAAAQLAKNVPCERGLWLHGRFTGCIVGADLCFIFLFNSGALQIINF